jgi:hypothetical protein
MHRAIPQLIMMLTGVVLVTAGTYRTLFPLLPGTAGATTLDANASALKLITDHPNLVLVTLGVVLLIVGYWGPRGPRSGQISN